MYRILAANHEVRERRDQLRHPPYAAPELLATAPNQVWSWDITKLLGPAKWTYFYLYVILDIFSRYVVGWMVAHHESAALAKKLIAQSCQQQEIAPGELTLHADRGPSMTSKPVALLLADLGVTKTHSRPHVSNDNPFSEAQFKTLKYRPEFPDRFGSIEDAARLLPRLLPLVQHRASPLGPRPADAPRRPLRAGREAGRGAGPRAGRGLRRPSRALRRGAAASAAAADRGLDQQAEGGARQSPIAIPNPRSSRTSRPEPRRATQRTRPIPRYPPESAVQERFGSIGGELNIAAVAPLNTEDLH